MDQQLDQEDDLGDLDDLLETPKVREASIEDHIVVDCRSCLDAMLLGKYWRELIVEDEVSEAPLCPDCTDPDEGDQWVDDADPVMDGIEYWAIAGDVIKELDRA